MGFMVRQVGSIPAITHNIKIGKNMLKEEFEELIRQDALYEYARYVDNYYGTPKAYVEEQLAAGKSPDAVAKHISRYGVEFLPVTVAEHLTVMGNSGFAAVELFWSSYMQAGFY